MEDSLKGLAHIIENNESLVFARLRRSVLVEEFHSGSGSCKYFKQWLRPRCIVNGQTSEECWILM